MKEWTIIRCIQLGPKKPTATAAAAAAAAAEKTIFDCVPCNKSFPKIHFFYSCYPFVYLVGLPSSLSSLIVIPYPFDPGK